jgi:hypothetical protein
MTAIVRTGSATDVAGRFSVRACRYSGRFSEIEMALGFGAFPP